MASTRAMVSCLACNKPGPSRCSSCGSAAYCSAACQKADWPVHKLLCRTFADFGPLNRPTKGHVRGIAFPVAEEKPKFTWIRCDEGEDEEISNVAQMAEPITLDSVEIQFNPVLRRPLSDIIWVTYKGLSFSDGSPFNQSIASIMSLKPGVARHWFRGPVTCRGTEGDEIAGGQVRDLDMSDFRHIADFFQSYNPSITATEMSPAAGNTTSPPTSPAAKVQGVRINTLTSERRKADPKALQCLGDRRLFGKPEFEAVEVALTDPIFSSDHETPEIAQRVGLPLFTRRLPQDPKWQSHDGLSPSLNKAATFLHQCLDPQVNSGRNPLAMEWGWAPSHWQQNVGSILVVRQNKEPLRLLEPKMLNWYCQHEARASIARSLSEYDPENPMTKEKVLAVISGRSFISSFITIQMTG